MRGRSSSAKARLRSAGYKCNLCGRRLIDAISLERHQKTIHNVNLKGNKLQKKPKEREKLYSELRKELNKEQFKCKSKNNNQNLSNTKIKESAEDGKIHIKKDIDQVSEQQSVENEGKNKNKTNADAKTYPVLFECPRCTKAFCVYFNAHKHIQKAHSKDKDVQKLQPIRVESCDRCEGKIRSDEEHICSKDLELPINILVEYVCFGCNNSYNNLKSFDMHVSGLHSDGVDSMFFPTKLEFMTWRLEMERLTNAKYSLYGEYDTKKVYRCNHAKHNSKVEKHTVYFCPSCMVVKDFEKGIQVHYFKHHFGHTSIPYTLSSKYKKYSITSILRTSEENLILSARLGKIDDKELYPLFKKLMNGIVTSAAEVDISVLKDLIKSALKMSAIITEAGVNETPFTKIAAKLMSDKEITKELQMETEVQAVKRGSSVDSDEIPNPAKRMRNNQSLFNQNPIELSPKIVNTFSLASDPINEETKLDNGEDVKSTNSDDSDKVKEFENKTIKSDLLLLTNKNTKMNTKLSSLSESLSFNDSYKDFIDKNFISKSELKSTKNTVKTRLGEFKQTSPKKGENKLDATDLLVMKRVIKPIPSNKPKVEEAPAVKNTVDVELNKVNILNIEKPDLTITKLGSGKTNALKGTNTQLNNSKMDTPKGIASKKKDLSQLVDPLETKNTSANIRDSTSSIEPLQDNVSKVNTKLISRLVDPLEINITKANTEDEISPAVVQKNIANSKRSPSVKQSKLNAKSSKLQHQPNTTKMNIKNTPKVYSGPKSKVNSPILPIPKVEDKTASPSSAKITPLKTTELKYEVREQDNDCNILVLKL